MSRPVLLTLLIACAVGAASFGGFAAASMQAPLQASPEVVAAATPVDVEPVPIESEPDPAPVARRGGIACAAPHELVSIEQDAAVRSRPGGPRIGTLPARSVYMGQATRVWVKGVSADGRWGRITLPWVTPVTASGWIELAGLARASTRILVVADLSERMLRVYRGCSEILRASTAVGRPGSPSPQGRFWVTDRIAVPAAQQDSFGSYAFGISAVQPNLPAGWTGGNQMAIHGTGAPGSIGEAASAGCLRTDEATLAKLRPLLRVGTPVVIQA